MLIFIRTFESFEVPALVGLAGNINVLTTNDLSERAAHRRAQLRRVRRLFDVPASSS